MVQEHRDKLDGDFEQRPHMPNDVSYSMNTPLFFEDTHFRCAFSFHGGASYFAGNEGIVAGCTDSPQAVCFVLRESSSGETPVDQVRQSIHTHNAYWSSILVSRLVFSPSLYREWH